MYLCNATATTGQSLCFSEPNLYFTGAGEGIYGAVADDFNGDGYIDLVTSNSTGNNISIILGDSNGSFGSPVNYATGAVASGMNKGDFNNDGKLDVVVTNQADHSISVLLGNGDGTLNPAINSPIVSGQPFVVVCHDFDNNSILDLVVACYSGDLLIMTGDGEGNFSVLNTYFVSAWMGSINLADFNNDGTLDIAVPGGFSYEILFLEGLGGGNFALPVVLNCSERPFYTLATDLNSDSLPDIIAANWLDTCITVFFNSGNFSFDPPLYYLFPGPSWASPGTVDLADFNYDGISDLLVSFGTLNGIAVLRGTGNGNFLSAQHFTGASGSVLVIAADVNQDGKTDVIDPSQNSSAYYVLLNCTENTGMANFSQSNINLTLYPSPFTSEINIQHNSRQSFQFTLFTSFGEKIIDKSLMRQLSTIDLSAYPCGIYLYQLAFEKSKIKTGKLIKQ